jgi:hypothetical protein
MHRLVERAQAMGGTCTGEHGIGQAELGPEALDAMCALKQALDPQNISIPARLCRRRRVREGPPSTVRSEKHRWARRTGVRK